MSQGSVLMVQRYKNRRFDCWSKARVYRNLHRGGYSVMQHGLVVGHADRVMMTGCKMIVHPAGVARAQREGRKNVHAFIEGVLVYSAMGTDWDDPRPLPADLRYVLGRGFRTSWVEKDVEVVGAMAVKLGPKSASYAYGIYRHEASVDCCGPQE